tara:strand:- start:257 stop:460 length:204 start_codon:yes stop_codon:yes gene_type:complete
MFAVYLKEGYNVVRRYQKGNTADDKIDFFEHLGCYKDLEVAKRFCKKQEGVVEIKDKSGNPDQSRGL